MSSYSIRLDWRRTTPDFDYKTFNRGHLWHLAGGHQTVPGSSAPEYSGDPEMSNPEEALLASLSSCHMLTFLAIAALKKLVVDSYEDEPLADPCPCPCRQAGPGARMIGSMSRSRT